MKNTPKEALKHLLGEIPYTAELYWLIRQHGKPIASRFSLERLNLAIPGIVEETRALKLNNPDPKRVFIFASMHFWIDIVKTGILINRNLICDVKTFIHERF